MNAAATLGRSALRVPRLGVGTMTWGDPKGLARLNPATLAYGGAHGADEEERAFRASVAAGVTLFDTAAMYSNGASKRRLCRARPRPGRRDRHQVPARTVAGHRGPAARARCQPRPAGTHLNRPVPAPLPLPAGIHPRADAPDGRRRAGGQGQRGRGQQLLRRPDADRTRRAGRTRHPPGLQPGQLLAAAPAARNQRRPGHLPATRDHPDRLHAAGHGSPHRQVLSHRHAARAAADPGPTFRGKAIRALQPVVALLREIGEPHAKSPAQVALRWLLENEHVLPIPGAKNGQQAAHNAGALTFHLTPPEIAALDHATRAWRG